MPRHTLDRLLVIFKLNAVTAYKLLGRFDSVGLVIEHGVALIGVFEKAVDNTLNEHGFAVF